MTYNVAKLAAVILSQHKDIMKVMSTEKMPVESMSQLIEALKDDITAKTVFYLLPDLKESDFLAVESPPTQEVLKVIPATQESINVPNIFNSQKVEKCSLVNITKLLELWIIKTNPVNLPEGLKVELEGGFLHLNKQKGLDCEQFLKIDDTVIDGNFFITKEGHKPISNNIFGGYGTDSKYYKKAWLKMYLLIGYIGELLTMSEKIKMGIANIVNQCGEDLSDTFLEDISSLVNTAFDIQYKEMTQEERNYQSLTIINDMFYMSKVKGQKTADNLYAGYSCCSFIGGGDNQENRPLDCDEEFLASCLNLNSNEPTTKPAPVTKPIPPAFKIPEGTDEIAKICNCLNTPDNKEGLQNLRNLAIAKATELNKTDPDDMTNRITKQIKLIENWLSA